MVACQVQLGVWHCRASVTLLNMEAIYLYKRRAVGWLTAPDHEGWPTFPGSLAPNSCISGETARHLGNYYCLVRLKDFKFSEGLYSRPSGPISWPYHPVLLMKHGAWGLFPSCCVNRQTRYSRQCLPFRHISPWQKKTSVPESSVVCPCHYRMPCDLCSLVAMWYGSLALKRIIINSSSEPHTEDTLKTKTWGPDTLHDFKAMRIHTCLSSCVYDMEVRDQLHMSFLMFCLLVLIVWYCCLELVYEVALLSSTGIISICCQTWLFFFKDSGEQTWSLVLSQVRYCLRPFVHTFSQNPINTSGS